MNLVLRKPQQFTSSPNYSEILIIKVLSKFQTFLSGKPGSKIESNLKGKVSNGCTGCTSILGGWEICVGAPNFASKNIGDYSITTKYMPEIHDFSERDVLSYAIECKYLSEAF